MKLFVTDDLAASCLKAHDDFTHNVLHQRTESIAPRLLDTAPIAGIVSALYAPWHGELGQVKRWRQKGGLLLWRAPEEPPAHDVLLVVEPPPSIKSLHRLTLHTAEYAVVQRPMWSTMRKTVELSNPTTEEIERIWKYCKGRRVKVAEASRDLRIPEHYLTRMWASAGRTRYVEVTAGLMPDTPEAREWWGNLPNAPKKLLRMWLKNRNIIVKRGAEFGTTPPDYERLAAKRERELTWLEELRSLLESLPVHPTK